MPNRFFLQILCFFIASGNVCFGQNHKIDSLITILKTLKEDTNRVDKLNEIALKLYHIGSYDIAIVYANEAKDLAINLNYNKGLVSAYSRLGNDYQKKSNYKLALKNHFSALSLSKEIKFVKGITASYNNISIVLQHQGNYSEALKNQFEALRISENIKDSSGIAQLYNSIGIVYDCLGNDSLALNYFYKSLKIQIALGNKFGLIDSYGNIAGIYYDFNHLPEALQNYLLALKIAEEIGDKQSILNCYDNISNVYADQGNSNEALKILLVSSKLANELGDKKGESNIFGNIGEVYMDLKNYTMAKHFIEKAINLGKEINSKVVLKNQYKSLSSVCSLLGDFKIALEYQKLSALYKDSIYNEKNSQQINELSAQYESEKKEKEIAQLNLDVFAKQKKVEQKNFIIYSTVAGAILVLVLVALLYNRNQLKQKNTYQTSMAKQREENALAVLQAQENERTRIAKDLHDGVGAFLSTLKLNVQTLENALSAEKTAYNNTLDLIDKTSVELRNVMNNLSDETLQQQGLIAAISELTLRVNQIGVTQIRFQHHGFEKRINNIIEINLYRAAQELVQNCLKHAVAKKATLQLIEHDTSIVLMIEDNGVGFNPDDDKVQNKQGGMGLNNIRKRIAFIKGSVQIESAPQKGTTWVIEVPKQFA